MRLFGPSRKEIWRQLSAEVGGQFVDGGVWRGSKVHVFSAIATFLGGQDISIGDPLDRLCAIGSAYQRNPGVAL